MMGQKNAVLFVFVFFLCWRKILSILIFCCFVWLEWLYKTMLCVTKVDFYATFHDPYFPPTGDANPSVLWAITACLIQIVGEKVQMERW